MSVLLSPAERATASWNSHLGPRGWDERHRALTALREITDPYT